jgi:hypothetical protein
MIDRRIAGALRGNHLRAVGEATGRDCRAVDHRDDAIDRQFRADRRPVERLDERLRQRQPRGFDDDVIRPVRQRQQRLDRGDEIIGDGAAEAAVGELDDVFLRARLDAAGAQDVAVDADVAEFIDDQRQPAFSRMWRIIVVLPAPRNPVTMVTGVLERLAMVLDMGLLSCCLGGERIRRRVASGR